MTNSELGVPRSSRPSIARWSFPGVKGEVVLVVLGFFAGIFLYYSKDLPWLFIGMGALTLTSVYLAFSLIADVFGILVIIGVLMALFRRYIWKPRRLDNRWEDLGTLLIILVAIVSGFVVEGLRIAATELQANPDWAVWSPGGWVFAKAFGSMSQDALQG